MEVHSGVWGAFLNSTCPQPAFQIYQGHTHYIMNIAINPKDANTFASACLDRTVKMWSLTSGTPNFSLDAHEKVSTTSNSIPVRISRTS